MDKETKVAPGWKHIYMGFGNHLVIKEDHFNSYYGVSKGSLRRSRYLW